MELLKGAPVAKSIAEEVKKTLQEHPELNPCLAIVRVGEKPEDLSYERSAVKAMEKAGVSVKCCSYPEDIPEEEFLQAFSEINGDPEVNGILLFRPLPKHISADKVRMMMRPEKDVDSISVVNEAGIYTDRASFYPCTAEAVIRLLEYYGIGTEGKRAAVIGRSLVIGKPVAMMLLRKNATVTLCHSRTKNLPEVTREADILVAAVGKAGLVRAEHVRPGAAVIDVGINVLPDGQLAGDCDPEEIEKGGAACLSPVPGGVGRITTSVLLSHVVEAALKQKKA